jgi:uroporphyrinogen decarboxylase
MNWTSRERVIATINHNEPDRVPIDVQPGFDFYLSLKGLLGLEIEENIQPSYFREVIPHPRVCEEMGWDVISIKLVKPESRPSRESDDPDSMVDVWGVERKRINQPGGGCLWEAVKHPLANAKMEDLNSYPWPNPEMSGVREATEAFAKMLFEDTDLAIIGRFGGTIIETALDLMGFQNWLMAAVAEPQLAGALLDKITDIAIKLDRLGLDAAGKYIQILKVSGDDLGMQTGLIYSPTLIRELLLPRLKRRWQAARKYIRQELDLNIPLMFHTDGAVRAIIPDLIQAGVDILNPIQPFCQDMLFEELKDEFGDRLVFHGGIDIQRVLPFGSSLDVESHVKEVISALAPGGGYILSPTHIVQADTPPENIITMTQTAQTFGVY